MPTECVEVEAATFAPAFPEAKDPPKSEERSPPVSGAMGAVVVVVDADAAAMAAVAAEAIAATNSGTGEEGDDEDDDDDSADEFCGTESSPEP